MKRATFGTPLLAALMATLAGCGGGGSTTSSIATQQTGTLPLMVSDDSSQDWATIGVKILSIALVPQGGGANVTVYSASAVPPTVNLVQLDQIAEILGNVSVPAGTYSGAVVTVSGNPGDVLLVTSADPESGFAGAASTQIPASDIQIQHTQGTTGNLSVPVTVTFDSPLVVTATSSNALDLEFDLSHPAFIIAHQPAGSGSVLWAVNFNGPIRHHPIADIGHLVLRHLYGTVSAIAADGSSLTVTRDWPTLPIVSPETAVTGSQSLTIQADSTNGTLFYDLDDGSSSTVRSFAGLQGLSDGQYLRVAARYQENGTLIATRIWASSSFNTVWVSPEGHVLDVDAPNGTLTVLNEAGQPVTLAVNSSTQFYFQDGTTPIGSGTAFLSAGNIVRGFKIDATTNPLSNASPAVAESINIETAAFSGQISGANTSSFTYTHDFVRTQDDYQVTLNYLSASTPNGTDASGNAINGFKWWNFAFPTIVNDGGSAIGDFVSATSSATLSVDGVSAATWADPANSTGWSAADAILLPSPVPLASVSSSFTNGSFGITTLSPSATYTVNVSATAGQATLVYQVDRTGNVLSISPVDITTASGLAQFSSALVGGTPVKVFGVPRPNGALQADVVLYYTGLLPQG